MSAPRRPRLDTVLRQLEYAAELPAIELGARVAMAMELEHVRPDLAMDRANLAARIARAKLAAVTREATRSRRGGVVYLLHFDQRYKHAGPLHREAREFRISEGASRGEGRGVRRTPGCAVWAGRCRKAALSRGPARWPRRPRCPGRRPGSTTRARAGR